MKKAKLDGLTGIEKKVVRLRGAGMSYRKIEAKLFGAEAGNGSWALRVARRAGVK